MTSVCLLPFNFQNTPLLIISNFFCSLLLFIFLRSHHSFPEIPFFLKILVPFTLPASSCFTVWNQVLNSSSHL